MSDNEHVNINLLRTRGERGTDRRHRINGHRNSNRRHRINGPLEMRPFGYLPPQN